jgi:hypothetical protein
MLRLDMVWLNKHGCLSPGGSGNIFWTSGYGKKSSISYVSTGDALRLTFTVSVNGGEGEDVEQTVYLERTPCRFGGERPWFLCPGCGRRVGVLYGRRRFLCRLCHKLAYASQCETRSDRLLRRANKIRRRLSGEAGMNSFTPKPKRMRLATFERMIEEINELENESLMMVAVKFGFKA